MPDYHAVGLFIVAAVALLIIPGPAVGYVVAQSLARGARFGVAAAAGNVTGGLLHIALALAGMATLIVRYPAAYDALRYAGAVYLIWLGIEQLRARPVEVETTPSSSVRNAYLGGVVVNATNPKGLLFFGAFLPQFLRPEAGNVTYQIAFFGALFSVMAFLSDSTYAILASRLHPLIRDRGRMQVARFFGAAVYVALGIAAALLRRR